MPKKKKPSKERTSYTNFPVMLHVDSEGQAHWLNNAKDYLEALHLVEQNHAYCPAAEREKEARKDFDEMVVIAEIRKRKREKGKLDAVELEEKYGRWVRKAYLEGTNLRKLTEIFELTQKQVKLLIREV